MALAPANAAARARASGADAPADLKWFVFVLFFVFGGITSLNDVLIPKLKELFTLNYTQAMLIQFCFFTAYLVVGIPGARLVKRLGYMRGAVAGLVVMLIGCLLFIPASQGAVYELFLLALFVLASGVMLVQVVANPLISLLGTPQTAHSRLTFAQAFNSLGTTIFPYFGAILILGSLASVGADQLSGQALEDYRRAESQAIWQGYLGLAVVLAIVAGAVWMFRNRLPRERHQSGSGLAGLDLLARPRFGFGALCIFVYVGAEVAIGSLIVNFLQQSSVLGMEERAAGELIAFYWGGAMVGRFIGSAILRVVSPGLVLACAAAGAITLILIATNTTGSLAGYSLLAVGLVNSIMFPTIFSLACERLGSRAADGSGIINVAIFGGAVVPLATGALADISGSLAAALLLPAACYGVIAAYGIYCGRNPAHDYGDDAALEATETTSTTHSAVQVP